MGCACFKSDVVIKANKNILNLSSNNLMSIQENYSRRESHQNNLNNRISQRNSSNENLNNNINLAINNRRNQSSLNRNTINNSNNNNQRNSSVRNNLYFSEYLQNLDDFQPHLQMNEIPDFNMSEINNVYVGVGFKRMKGYVCKISREQLKRKREEFWSTRVQGESSSWELLRFLCETKELDEEAILTTMQDTMIKPLRDCINIVYDSKGILYEIPNYCINDPYKFELEEDSEKINSEQIQELILKIFVKKSSCKWEIKISNFESILGFKKKLDEIKHELIPSADKIRLFFGGKELQNNKKICDYKIEDENFIQIL